MNIEQAWRFGLVGSFHSGLGGLGVHYLVLTGLDWTSSEWMEVEFLRHMYLMECVYLLPLRFSASRVSLLVYLGAGERPEQSAVRPWNPILDFVSSSIDDT